VIRKSSGIWDGGYAIAGVIGSGDLFVMRDPNGIRPCWYIDNDEVLAFASERVALMSVFEVPEEQVKELPAGHVAVMKSDATLRLERFVPESPPASCSFERIYFSRG